MFERHCYQSIEEPNPSVLTYGGAAGSVTPGDGCCCASELRGHMAIPVPVESWWQEDCVCISVFAHTHNPGLWRGLAAPSLVTSVQLQRSDKAWCCPISTEGTAVSLQTGSPCHRFKVCSWVGNCLSCVLAWKTAGFSFNGKRTEKNPGNYTNITVTLLAYMWRWSIECSIFDVLATHGETLYHHMFTEGVPSLIVLSSPSLSPVSLPLPRHVCPLRPGGRGGGDGPLQDEWSLACCCRGLL